MLGMSARKSKAIARYLSMSTAIGSKLTWQMHFGPTVKAILRDVMGTEKNYFSLFFIIHYVMTLVVTISPALGVVVLGTLRNMEYCTQHVLPSNTTL